MANPMYIVAGLQAATSMMSARAQAKGLASQAAMDKVQARSEALKYKQQGVKVLENILQTDALIVARAGAGGIDPFSGSAKTLSDFALAKGIEEKQLSDDGALIAIRTGMMQADQRMMQAKATMLAGVANAATAFGEAYAFDKQLGTAPAGEITKVT